MGVIKYKGKSLFFLHSFVLLYVLGSGLGLGLGSGLGLGLGLCYFSFIHSFVCVRVKVSGNDWG